MIASHSTIEYVSARMSASSGDAAYMIWLGVTPSTLGDVPFFRFFMALNIKISNYFDIFQ